MKETKGTCKASYYNHENYDFHKHHVATCHKRYKCGRRNTLTANTRKLDTRRVDISTNMKCVLVNRKRDQNSAGRELFKLISG